MTLVKRMTRLFKADIHGILDSLEEPEAVLKQAIRDMEEEIEKTARELLEIEVEYERTTGSRNLRADALLEIEKQIDVCFNSENDALAKTFIRRRLEGEKLLGKIEERLKQIESHKETSERKLAEQKEKLSAIVEKMEVFGQFAQVSAGIDEDSWETSEHVSDEQVEVAFLKEQQLRKADSTTAS